MLKKKYLLDGGDHYIHVMEDGTVRYCWLHYPGTRVVEHFSSIPECLHPQFIDLMNEHGVKPGPELKVEYFPYVCQTLVAADDAVPMLYMYELRQAERRAYRFSPLGDYNDWFISHGRRMRDEMRLRQAAGLDKGFYAAAEWKRWSTAGGGHD